MRDKDVKSQASTVARLARERNMLAEQRGAADDYAEQLEDTIARLTRERDEARAIAGEDGLWLALENGIRARQQAEAEAERLRAGLRRLHGDLREVLRPGWGADENGRVHQHDQGRTYQAGLAMAHVRVLLASAETEEER